MARQKRHYIRQKSIPLPFIDGSMDERRGRKIKLTAHMFQPSGASRGNRRPVLRQNRGRVETVDFPCLWARHFPALMLTMTTGRSKPEPSLFMSEGARLMVVCWAGMENPQLRNTALKRLAIRRSLLWRVSSCQFSTPPVGKREIAPCGCNSEGLR